MKTYNLELMGLRTELHTPGEITISHNLIPFLCEAHQKTDCRIELRSCANMPAFSENGVWHGPEFYDCVSGVRRIFHCVPTDKTVFGVTQLFDNGNIEIRVLPEYLSYFAGSEGIFNRIGMETLLLQHNGLLLHASLIKYGDRAIVFSGPSGIGKSTQADIWEKYLAADILNGDRAALRKTPEGWTAYGSPYAGTSGIYKNDNAPLAAIVLLGQAQENSFQRLTATQALQSLYPELSVHHWDKGFVEKATDLCLQLVEDVPVYRLKCRPEESAAMLVKKGLGL